MNIRLQIEQIVSKAFEAMGYDAALGEVTVSNRPDLCQFQCNGAMAAAKRYKANPFTVATAVVERLSQEPMFRSVEVARPGFINLSVTDAVIADTLTRMLADDRLGLPTMPPKTIVMDYGGANVAKPLHVGHLRTAIIGRSLSAVARFLGHRVITDVHLGDWGLQMGQVIALSAELYPDLPYFDADFTGPYPDVPPYDLAELDRIYPEASGRCKVDTEFAERAKQATAELQTGRPGYRALWQHIRAISVADLRRNYDRLDATFDLWYGESDAAPYVQPALQLLRDKGLLVESEGAMIVDVSRPEDTEPMPPILLVKSNGSDIYGSTDLATIYQREQDFHPDEMWYMVDTRQTLHFKQVFRCARLGGIASPETAFHHVNNGTINGSDGKPFKTRAGGVMRLSTLIDMAVEAAYEKTGSGEVQLSEETRRQVAETVGVAALKVGDLVNHRARDYIFDTERFLQSEGKTGPYLQYCAVRIQSVLKKAPEGTYTSLQNPASDTERDLMLCLQRVGDTLLRTHEEKAPNILCEMLFDIAGLFNRFYGETRILSCADEAQRASWLTLLTLTLRMLNLLLDLLGIQVPENM